MSRAPDESTLLARLGAHTVLAATDLASPPFEIDEAKIAVPADRPDTIFRTALVNRLRVAAAHAVVTVLAPAGYGKTTLLAQWAKRDARPFAWMTLDERDEDAVVLLRHLAVALDRIGDVDWDVLEALASSRDTAWSAAAPRIASAVAAFPEPFVLVLDDAHVLRAGVSADAIAAVGRHLPPGSALVLAGRSPSCLPVGTLRADGRLVEVDADLLAFTRREAALLFDAAGLAVPPDEVDRLHLLSEGWPAALYLTGLALRDGEVAGRYVGEYLQTECFSRVSEERLAFLRRTSVLELLDGPACDAVLARDGSAAELAEIEASSLFLVPADRGASSYRYHALVRELLGGELARREPELVPVLHARAAEWFEERGDAGSALAHARAAGDTDRAARLLVELAPSACRDGRIATLERWFERFDDDGLAAYPEVAASGAWFHALRGDAEAAGRWLAAVDGSPPAAVLHAALCRKGVERMVADAAEALAGVPRSSPWHAAALLVQGTAWSLAGEPDRADGALAAAVEAGARSGSGDVLVAALVERALVADAAGDAAAAEELVREAGGGGDGYATAALRLALTARLLLRQGRWSLAREQLAAASRIAPRLTSALPWLAVQARLELAKAFVTLRDGAAAREQIAEADGILALRPGLGTLVGHAEAVRREIDGLPVAEQAGRSSGLTSAELRLLPLLATHLSFREIGERLYVSRNTIKTQAISVYRKLGVSTRSDAIDRATELGLMESTLHVVVPTSSRQDDAEHAGLRSNYVVGTP